MISKTSGLFGCQGNHGKKVNEGNPLGSTNGSVPA